MRGDDPVQDTDVDTQLIGHSRVNPYWHAGAIFLGPYASESLGDKAHVIGAAPLHADGSVEHQTLLLNAAAHEACRSFLAGYIDRFSLDGAQHEGAYGSRDHEAIKEWSAQVAARAKVPVPGGTSQDRMRELAWKIARGLGASR